MSYSTDPVADAARHFGALQAAQDLQQQAEASAIEDFITACQKLDANAIADFAPKTVDWDISKRQPRAAGAPMPMRKQTLAEVLEESLDYGSGPSKTELMQLALSLAFSSECHANQSQRARQLLVSMADAWARHNVVAEA